MGHVDEDGTALICDTWIWSDFGLRPAQFFGGWPADGIRVLTSEE